MTRKPLPYLIFFSSTAIQNDSFPLLSCVRAPPQGSAAEKPGRAVLRPVFRSGAAVQRSAAEKPGGAALVDALKALKP
jgi:hypothetical protein